MPSVPWKLLPKPDISKYDSIPMYMYTEKDGLNRVTVLKEASKENYLVAGRYATSGPEGRFYNPLSDEERAEIERMLRGSRKEAAINFL
jgi:hypothetical protein